MVLNLELPYRLGDWIILDEVIQGEVIEANWRATHVLLGSHDVAIVPNSVIAQAKLINWAALMAEMQRREFNPGRLSMLPKRLGT